MALKNTYTNSPVEKMLNEIQKALLRVKATDISHKFDGSGQITGLRFGLDIKGNPVSFMLPIQVAKVRAVLQKEGNRRYDESAYVYRVAWACMRDWVVAQMALIETEMAEPLQVFLPYAHDASGKTLFEKVVSSGLLLGGGDK